VSDQTLPRSFKPYLNKYRTYEMSSSNQPAELAAIGKLSSSQVQGRMSGDSGPELQEDTAEDVEREDLASTSSLGQPKQVTAVNLDLLVHEEVDF
jgi:hypothetical protein